MGHNTKQSSEKMKFKQVRNFFLFVSVIVASVVWFVCAQNAKPLQKRKLKMLYDFTSSQSEC